MKKIGLVLRVLETVGIESSDRLYWDLVSARSNAILGLQSLYFDRLPCGVRRAQLWEMANRGALCNSVFVCETMAQWVFAERGILRASSITHTRQDGSAAELLLKQKERRDLPMSLFPEPEIAKNSQVGGVDRTLSNPASPG